MQKLVERIDAQLFLVSHKAVDVLVVISSSAASKGSVACRDFRKHFLDFWQQNGVWLEVNGEYSTYRAACYVTELALIVALLKIEGESAKVSRQLSATHTFQKHKRPLFTYVTGRMRIVIHWETGVSKGNMNNVFAAFLLRFNWRYIYTSYRDSYLLNIFDLTREYHWWCNGLLSWIQV